uniref:Uncharacterized protein n=1 Tax=Rhizophora mucronata TaxID=61149 RepID=A0A2P2N0P4_RHIMU
MTNPWLMLAKMFPLYALMFLQYHPMLNLN